MKIPFLSKFWKSKRPDPGAGAQELEASPPGLAVGDRVAYVQFQTVEFTITAVKPNGMIELEGQSGEFSPDLFVRAREA